MRHLDMREVDVRDSDVRNSDVRDMKMLRNAIVIFTLIDESCKESDRHQGEENESAAVEAYHWRHFNGGNADPFSLATPANRVYVEFMDAFCR